MTTTWVVIADAARARIVLSEGRNKPFRDIEQLVHGESRLRDTDRISDRPGRSFDSHGEGRHAMEPGTDPADQEAIRFAADIANHLRQARTGNEFDALVLVAPPRFLGLLRKAMDPGSRERVRAEIHKEFTQLDDEEIRRRIMEHL